MQVLLTQGESFELIGHASIKYENSRRGQIDLRVHPAGEGPVQIILGGAAPKKLDKLARKAQDSRAD